MLRRQGLILSTPDLSSVVKSGKTSGDMTIYIVIDSGSWFYSVINEGLGVNFVRRKKSVLSVKKDSVCNLVNLNLRDTDLPTEDYFSHFRRLEL